MVFCSCCCGEAALLWDTCSLQLCRGTQRGRCSVWDGGRWREWALSLELLIQTHSVSTSREEASLKRSTATGADHRLSVYQSVSLDFSLSLSVSLVISQCVINDAYWQKECDWGVETEACVCVCLFFSCSENVSIAVLLLFCSEGDNVPDAFTLVNHLNDWLHLLDKPVSDSVCGYLYYCISQLVNYGLMFSKLTFFCPFLCAEADCFCAHRLFTVFNHFSAFALVH